MQRLALYLARLSWSKTILWCYLCWYLTIVFLYFDLSATLWLSSLGISAIVGFALILSTGPRPEGWVIFRLFLMPFCVSSYSALIKGHGFILIFSPLWRENLFCLGSCAVFLLLQILCKAKFPRKNG